MKTRFYNDASARAYLLREYPACPEEHWSALIHLTSSRGWEGARLPKVMGIVVSNHIRHKLTVYEALLRRYKLSRREARLWVNDEVNSIAEQWRVGAPGRRKAKRESEH